MAGWKPYGPYVNYPRDDTWKKYLAPEDHEMRDRLVYEDRPRRPVQDEEVQYEEVVRILRRPLGKGDDIPLLRRHEKLDLSKYTRCVEDYKKKHPEADLAPRTISHEKLMAHLASEKVRKARNKKRRELKRKTMALWNKGMFFNGEDLRPHGDVAGVQEFLNKFVSLPMAPEYSEPAPEVVVESYSNDTSSLPTDDTSSLSSDVSSEIESLDLDYDYASEPDDQVDEEQEKQEKQIELKENENNNIGIHHLAADPSLPLDEDLPYRWMFEIKEVTALVGVALDFVNASIDLKTREIEKEMRDMKGINDAYEMLVRSRSGYRAKGRKLAVLQERLEYLRQLSRSYMLLVADIKIKVI